MLRIKKLDIFLVKQFLLLLAGTFFICQFVLMMQFLWVHVDQLIGKGLSLTVMAQFFWYMGLMLVPQAMPLAILLSSLITYGNLGENSELTAIKAAGISLMQTFRPLAIITILTCLVSFWFQNSVGPKANMKIAQLLLSMKQKSPELEIPEGIFYDGIPNCNLYVQKKNLDTGKLYGIMIYRMTGSYEDQAIVLADSGMLQSTADKKHLVLSLWSGTWHENMQSGEMANSAAVPYRREAFSEKKIVLDYDNDFNLTDANGLTNNAKAKGLDRIKTDLDSLNNTYDSIGRSFYRDISRQYYSLHRASKRDSVAAVKTARAEKVNIDTVFNRLKDDDKRNVVNAALSRVQSESNELGFREMITSDGDRLIRMHQIEAINKFTLTLSCLIFFFIGAPLGAIIRKGGLGIPMLISVIVFIIFYILDNVGYRMARQGSWAIWFGKGLATAVLAPTAVFFTYKANNDSMVFNMDAYRNFFIKLLGMRQKRHVMSKEVIINDPNYAADADQLRRLSSEIADYDRRHQLKSPPNVVNVFFKYEPDHEVERISEELEEVIDDLSNTRSRQVLSLLNNYPVVSVKAHTRPFERKWLNILAAVLVPVGAFLYCRMWRFRLRLAHDLRVIRETNVEIIKCIEQMKS